MEERIVMPDPASASLVHKLLEAPPEAAAAAAGGGRTGGAGTKREHWGGLPWPATPNILAAWLACMLPSGLASQLSFLPTTLDLLRLAWPSVPLLPPAAMQPR